MQAPNRYLTFGDLWAHCVGHLSGSLNLSHFCPTSRCRHFSAAAAAAIKCSSPKWAANDRLRARAPNESTYLTRPQHANQRYKLIALWLIKSVSAQPHCYRFDFLSLYLSNNQLAQPNRARLDCLLKLIPLSCGGRRSWSWSCRIIRSGGQMK